MKDITQIIIKLVKQNQPKSVIVQSIKNTFETNNFDCSNFTEFQFDGENIVASNIDEYLGSIVEKTKRKYVTNNAQSRNSKHKKFIYNPSASYLKFDSEIKTYNKIKSDLRSILAAAGWTEEGMEKPISKINYKDGVQSMAAECDMTKGSLETLTDFYFAVLHQEKPKEYLHAIKKHPDLKITNFFEVFSPKSLETIRQLDIDSPHELITTARLVKTLQQKLNTAPEIPTEKDETQAEQTDNQNIPDITKEQKQRVVNSLDQKTGDALEDAIKSKEDANKVESELDSAIQQLIN